MELDESTTVSEFLDNYRKLHGGRKPNAADAFIAGRESLRSWYSNHNAEAKAADLRRQLAECQADAERYRAKFQEMEEDWLAERKQVQIITEDRDYLLRQLAECAGTDSTVPMLQRIKVAVDSILAGLDPNEFDEPINWGDLYAASVSFRIDDDGRASTVVEIEEAAPGCEKLCATVAQRLSMLGWQNVAVDTEW